MIEKLNIDIETYSSVNLLKSGLYKYVQSPDFKILLFAYSVNGGETRVIDLENGDKIPRDIEKALLWDSTVTNHAYNAAFEWYCLSKHYEINPFDWLYRWRDTMLLGMYCGYTAGLAATANALGLPQDKRKMTAGKALIKLFCTPTKPTKKNAGRTRTLPHHEPEKWEVFKEYCRQDVEVEKAIDAKLANFPVPDEEQKLWELDQIINVTGVQVDRELVDGAIHVNDFIIKKLREEAVEITGLSNPNSAAQLKDWLEEKGFPVEDLQKDTVSKLIDLADGDVKRVLEIRQEMSKTSVKKFQAMIDTVGDDGRSRGLLQFYGANRTGRWAGRLVQVQNLPRNYIDSLESARELVKAKNINMLKFTYSNVPDILSQLIRTGFVPSKGHKFAISDFSAIEARVIAWLAGEDWRMQVFKTHGRIYEASASQMFGVPIDLIVKGNPEYELRAKGKVAELALGYQGAKGALIQMGALDMGLAEEELPDIVQLWRSSNRRIVDLWYSIENAALAVMRTGQPQAVKGIVLARESDIMNGLDFLTVTLPSGRKLYYVKPFLANNDFDKESIHYYGMNQTTKKFEKINTYGGKMVENIVQAIARDCLAVTLQRLYEAGYHTVMHIHDEVVLDVPSDQLDLDKVTEIMGLPIEWAPGLPLEADGFVADFYQKD
ncbi:DNA polymerase [Oceanobacillus neutriphilus]|uniref:DNA-directed DNA polymerase n=1 Tax=Oceanobacillus neutriphilus TaxID=531815 RepID=A0ABQ2NQ71_9BACI|nr:DNA polymerase [Oceanobacillus neutriphilus]